MMTPWCSEGEVPTSANLNLCGGSGSCVRWHSDDVALFGDRGDPKLIVSLILGSSALFKRKPRSLPDAEESSCWLHHGDPLVMDGCCQDEYLHCTDPRLGGERVNVTFRWIRNHLPQCPLGAGVVCCLPTSVQGSPFLAGAGFLWSGFFLAALVWVLLGGVFLLIARLLFTGSGRRVRFCFWARSLDAVQGKFRARRPGCRERGVNVTFRWISKHFPQCPLGLVVVGALPTCVMGSPVSISVGLVWAGILVLVCVVALLG